MEEVVFHGRLRNGGFGGNGKGGNGGSGSVPIPGEWTCPVSLAPHRWATKHSCYRCGHPRDGMNGGYGQGKRGSGQAKGAVNMLIDGKGGFFAAEMQHFSASVHLDVEAQVAGTLGV